MSLSVFKKVATTCAQVIVKERISKKLGDPSSKKVSEIILRFSQLQQKLKKLSKESELFISNVDDYFLETPNFIFFCLNLRQFNRKWMFLFDQFFDIPRFFRRNVFMLPHSVTKLSSDTKQLK